MLNEPKQFFVMMVGAYLTVEQHLSLKLNAPECPLTWLSNETTKGLYFHFVLRSKFSFGSFKLKFS